MLKWLSSITGGKNSQAQGKKRGRKTSGKPRRTEPVRVARADHGISRKEIDEHALKVLYRLNKAGYQACLVGGAVRDLLLGQHPKDFDVATDASPEQVKELFRNCRLIGRRFRLAHIHFGRQIIEVATFRADHDHTTDGHIDDAGRILRDNVYGSLDEDVWRRDFTANALYYDINDFSIIDFVGGLEHIHKRELKLIGDVETRFREDPVRMLRAVRFAAKLDFIIDDEIADAIHELGHLLNDIPPARLYEEALKMFQSGHAVASFAALREFRLLRYLFPLTDDALHEDPDAARFIELALQSTDARIANGLPVTPAFLFAAMLWTPLQQAAARDEATGMPRAMAMQQNIGEILSTQVRALAIPRRFTTVMRDIWAMQPRFRHRKGKRATGLLEHPKFRAAYDFLCLRAKAGEEVQEDADWWTEIQRQSPDEQSQQMKPKRSRGGRRRRSRSRRKPAEE